MDGTMFQIESDSDSDSELLPSLFIRKPPPLFLSGSNQTIPFQPGQSSTAPGLPLNVNKKALKPLSSGSQENERSYGESNAGAVRFNDPHWGYRILTGSNPSQLIEMPVNNFPGVIHHDAPLSPPRNPPCSKNLVAPEVLLNSQLKNPDLVEVNEALSRDFKYPESCPKTETNKPVTKEELAVSKPKVKDLETWMKDGLLATQRPAILLLSGPTGSGKTTAVHAVAKDLRTRVIEWITPMDEFQDDHENRFAKTSQATKFLDFLLAGSRYQPVIGAYSLKKIILVEDYPNNFLRNPSVFHDTVMEYCKKGRCPLVFITTDCRKKISLELFPEKLMQSAWISQICFNPVADTYMKRAIERIAMVQDRCSVNVVTRNEICAAAMGDVRSAENIWNFKFGGTSKADSAVPGSSRGAKRKGRKMEPPPKRKGDPSIDRKDPGYEKLHCVGRVLYAKRENAPVASGSQDKDSRGYLRTDPNTIVSQFLPERQSFVALAHENYPSIFSDIYQVATAADCLSLSDVISPDNRQDLEHLQEESFSVAVRGFMTSCTNPIKKWFPLRKSRLREVDENYEKFMQTVTERYAGSPYTLTTAKVDMIPMLHNLEKIHPYDKKETGSHSPIPHISDDSDEDV